jgi:serine/threonine protein kinase
MLFTRCLGACLTDNHHDLAIIMEYMPRNSLWTVLHDHSLDVKWHVHVCSERSTHDRRRSLRCAMLGDAARGMNYLHSRRPPIIHRDLKSHNLLVDESWRVKVSDFGLSRIISSSPSLNTMTACGTPCWYAC